MTRSFLSFVALVAASASAQPPLHGPIEAVLIHPPTAGRYQCSEHALGAEDHVGDALGTDCVVVRAGGGADGPFVSFYRGDGTQNEDWHGWEQPLLAPFASVVAAVYQNPVTNAPGTPGAGRASFVLFRRLAADEGGRPVHVGYVHARGVAVAVGDTVAAGQLVARIGNDGRSWHPHVHVGAFLGELGDVDAVPLQVRTDLAALGRLRGTAPPDGAADRSTDAP